MAWKKNKLNRIRLFCAEHAAELAHDIDIILQDQDVRQRHHPGEQNRKDECYSVDFIDGCGEEQYNIQSLSLD